MTHTGQRLCDTLYPLTEDDAAQDYHLAHSCAALARTLEQVADLSRDTDDLPGWGALLDPDLVPAAMIPWLAQFVGVRVPQRLSEADGRVYLRSTDGRRRGSPGAIMAAALPYLTGAKTVLMIERYGGSAYRLQVTTWESETPDLAAVERALLAQKPAGSVLTYSTGAGGDFETPKATHTDYDDVKEPYSDLLSVREDPSL